MAETLLLALKLSVAGLILAIGMGSSFSDITHLWRRPALLVRALLAMYVLVPLAAFLIVKVLPLSPGIKATMLVLAVSAGAPLLPRKLGNFGKHAYIFSLVVTSSLLAIVMVPAWVALLSRHFGTATEISPLAVALVIAKAFLLPLVTGMFLRALFPARSGPWSDRLMAASGTVLAACSVVLLVAGWRLLLELPAGGMAALMALMLVALVIGHLLGGPSPADREALAIACATRHIGVAVIVAAAFPGPKTVVIILAYLLASLAVTLPYLRWHRRRIARASGAPAAGG